MADFRISDFVQKALENDYEARNDDYILYYDVIKEKCPNVLNMTLAQVLLQHKYLLPNYDTISRVRRRIQSECPDLKTLEGMEIRKAEEMEYYDWARGNE